MKPAIRLASVRKEYRLYNGFSDQALDVLGLAWARFWRPMQYRTFAALDGIDLEIGHGERVGIVGRNGAGKTTLLKLITGNFVPTSGEIEVDGQVQALMQTGLGFHGEFTGLENIRASLVYNGLTDDELEAAVEDVIDFCELGDFINQPVKTYSLGMRARLQFAAATAIKPDIVIIDEVLGAGDAYFSGKSAARVKRLVASNSTLLLVSHSIQQILQFCTRVVWLEHGQTVMNGPALKVVRAYEEFSKKLEYEDEARRNACETRSVLADSEFQQRLLNDVIARTNLEDAVDPESTTAGLVRWQGEGGLAIERVRIRNATGTVTRTISVGASAQIEFDVRASRNESFPAIFAVVVYDIEDKLITRQISRKKIMTLREGEICKFIITFDEIRFGPGHYYFSAAIYKELNISNVSPYYDLLNRAIQFEVISQDSSFVDRVKQEASWEFRQ